MAASITVTVNSTNYVFTLDSSDKDSLRYLEGSSSLALPRVLVTRRVYPKKQKDFPGIARLNVKQSRMFSYADGTTAPIIMETTLSRRADTATADVELTRDLHVALLGSTSLDGLISALSL